MKTNMVTDIYGNETYVCELNAADVSNAIKEYQKYQDRKGSIYAMSEYKTPRLKEFVKLFFGEFDDGYIVPNTFKCSRKQGAEQLYNLLKGLEYHDIIEQCYCEVEISGNTIQVVYGDY